MKTLLLITCLFLSLTLNLSAQKVSTKEVKNCISNGKLEIIQKYLENQRYNFDTVFKDNSNLIHYALYKGQAEIAKYLISKNINVNLKDKWQYTPLLLSTRFRIYDITHLLVEKGADINVIGSSGSTPLRNSMQLLNEFKAEDFEIFKYLFEKGADYKFVCSKCCNRTYLMYAIIFHKEEMARYLISKGVDLEQTDCKGYTPILMAAERNNLDIFKVLYESGANPNVITKNGSSLSTICKKNNSIEILMLLKN